MDCSSKSLDISGPVAKHRYHNSSLVQSYHLLHKKKKLDRPKSEKKLESCKLTKGLSLADLTEDMPNSCKHPSSARLSSADSLEVLPAKNVDTNLLKPHASENVPKDDSMFKGIPDLKSLMTKNSTPSNSLLVQNNSLPDLQNIPIQNSLQSLNSPLHLNSPLEGIILDNINASKMPEVGSASSVEQSGKNCFSKNDNLQFSQYERSSLAELFQEHKAKNPGQCLTDMGNQPATNFTDLSLGSLSLSQLANRSHSSTGISELTGSLSSLAFRKPSSTRDLENLSLSDLIAGTIDIDNSQIKKESPNVSLSEVSSRGIDANIDLSVLIKSPDFIPKPVIEQSVASTPGTKLLISKLGKSSNSAADNKSSKSCLTRKPPFPLSWTKALAAKPSAFASTLCLRYPLKSCKRRTLHLYKTFLYSRQVQDIKDKDISPLIAITPFDFKSASPDDIVKANQKKAFTRE